MAGLGRRRARSNESMPSDRPAIFAVNNNDKSLGQEDVVLLFFFFFLSRGIDQVPCTRSTLSAAFIRRMQGTSDRVGKVPCLEQRMLRRERLSAELTKAFLPRCWGLERRRTICNYPLPLCQTHPRGVACFTCAGIRAPSHWRWAGISCALPHVFFFYRLERKRGCLLDVPDLFAHK